MADLETKNSWWWIKVHAIPVDRYLGRGTNGRETLREELEAENEGIQIPSSVKWLSGAPSVKARFSEGRIRASSVVLVVPDEEAYRLVKERGMRPQGRRYGTEAYDEIRPDVECGRCCGWGHIEAQCSRTAARCGWCAEEHETKAHRCPVEGCQAKKDHWCKHTVVKCGNFRGPHFAQANACPKRRAARSDAKGWRSPSPTCLRCELPFCFSAFSFWWLGALL